MRSHESFVIPVRARLFVRDLGKPTISQMAMHIHMPETLERVSKTNVYPLARQNHFPQGTTVPLPPLPLPLLGIAISRLHRLRSGSAAAT